MESLPVCDCQRTAVAAGTAVAITAVSVAMETVAVVVVVAAAAAVVTDAVVEVAEAEVALAGMMAPEAAPNGRRTHASRELARPCEAISLAAAASPSRAPSLPILRATHPCLHCRG